MMEKWSTIWSGKALQSKCLEMSERVTINEFVDFLSLCFTMSGLFIDLCHSLKSLAD